MKDLDLPPDRSRNSHWAAPQGRSKRLTVLAHSYTLALKGGVCCSSNPHRSFRRFQTSSESVLPFALVVLNASLHAAGSYDEPFLMDAVIVENGSKNYRIYAKPADRLKELIFRGRKFHEDFWALRNVSFRVPKGSTFGVVGENGSGKSTLLQMIAGTLQPTEGTITRNGRVAALLELGAGFNPEFTGRENVVLNAAIMGLTEQETVQRLPEIERFAEIGNFIDQPVKTYSSGMYVRLAFAVAIHVDPEILLVDEALSVGDVYFQQRCMKEDSPHERGTARPSCLFPTT